MTGCPETISIMDKVDRSLTVNEFPDYLAVPPATANGWRHRSGPLGFRVGRLIRSRRFDIERGLETALTASNPAVSAR